MWQRVCAEGFVMRIAFIVLMAMVMQAQAISTTNLWPSWLSPVQGGYSRGNEALSGAVERLTVTHGSDAWTNFITTNIWADYFSDWAKLNSAKGMMKQSLESSTAYADWYADVRWIVPTNYNHLTNAVTLGKQNLLQNCAAPSNWFEVTPHTGMSSSSNGWMFFDTIISNMNTLCITFVLHQNTEGYNDPVRIKKGTWWFGYSYNSYDEAMANASIESVVTNGEFGGYYYQYDVSMVETIGGLEGDRTNYNFNAYRDVWEWLLPRIVNYESKADVYLSYDKPDQGVESVFDGHYDFTNGYVDKTQTGVVVSARTASESNFYFTAHEDSADIMPTNRVNDTADGFSRSRGWWTYYQVDNGFNLGPHVIYKLNVSTNGFKYFR